MHLRAFRFRLRWLAAFLLGLSACGAASPSVRDGNSAEVAVVRDTPGLFLYAVRGERGTSHLLGTIHIGFGFDEVLTPDARARFDAAARVMTEADVSSTDPGQLVRAALLPPGGSLRALLEPSTWDALRMRLGAKLPEPVLDKLEPWLPTVMLGLDELERVLVAHKPGADRRLMDVELMEVARAAHKPVTHLETIAEQIAIFDAIPLEEQVRELTHALDKTSSEQARALIDAFGRGDERALTDALFEDEQLASAPGFYERVLFQRNERWLPVIEREIAQGGAFIAVGAAHLLGDKGVLATLRARGYLVTRVGG
ncbi:MAG: TraB/GumN family protein [Polyangiales bacterium]